jgi:two-component system phosphate regulon sensor histidine kinase PhoR
MQKKLLGTYVMIISITIIIAVLISWGQLDNYLYDRLEKESITQIKLIEDILLDGPIDDDAYLDEFVKKYSEKTGLRITLINESGDVIGESDSDKYDMNNHLNREEVANALATHEIYTSMRYSETLDAYYFYVATTIETDDFNGVLRTATQVNEMNSIVFDMLQTIMFGILIGSGFAILIAFFITKKLMNPIDELTEAAKKFAEGNYENKIYINQKDQIGQLADAFNSMTQKLKSNLWQLEHKNAELESILTSMSNGILVVNNDYKVTLYNNKFIELFNVSDVDIKGKLFFEVTRNYVIFEMIEKSLEQREFIVTETKIKQDKGYKTYLIYVNPIQSKEDDSHSLGVLLMVQDVTQIRKLENMRTDFVSNVTHELKTPLTSIRGFVDTLKNGAIDDKTVAMRFLEIIEIEAERLQTLIQDILSLSEIEGTIGDKNISPTNIGEVIQEVVTILEPKAKEKDIAILVEIEENMNFMPCNRDRIKQLFINLVDNAIKYTEKGRVLITCKEEFKWLLITVEDTGIGIESKHIPRLFERFYRVDKGRSRKMGGTGLGLSIVKHITELYSGRLSVESEVGKGTIIKVRFPI